MSLEQLSTRCNWCPMRKLCQILILVRKHHLRSIYDSCTSFDVYVFRPNNARGMSSGSTVSSGSSDSLAKDVAINGVVNGIAEEIGRPPTQVLLNWELQHLETASPIIGVRKMLHLEDNLGALKFTLTSKQIESLNNVSKYEPGYPVDYIGTSYKTSPWVRWNIPSQ